MRRVEWLGTSRRDLRRAPAEIRSEFGYILYLLQANPDQARERGHLKKFPGNDGLWRIRVRGWRLTYGIDNDAIYVVRVSWRENAYSGL